MQYPRDISFHGQKNPIALPRLGVARDKKKENGRHQNAGGGDTDRDQNAELNEPGGITQDQGQKTDRRGQCAEEYSAPEVMNRAGDGSGMGRAFIPRLLVAAVN